VFSGRLVVQSICHTASRGEILPHRFVCDFLSPCFTVALETDLDTAVGSRCFANRLCKGRAFPCSGRARVWLRFYKCSLTRRFSFSSFIKRPEGPEPALGEVYCQNEYYKPNWRPAQQEEEAGLAQGKPARQHRMAAA
jgi:hypothetical protein